MKENNNELISSRKSVPYFIGYHDEGDPVFESRPQYHSSFYPGMLIEDIRLSIMPYSHSKWSLNASIEPFNEKLEKLIIKSIEQDRFSSQLKYYRRNLNEVLEDFIRNCADEIMSFGEAIYEIEYLSDPETEEIVEFKLVHIPARTLKWQDNKLMIYVPNKLAKERNISQYIEISHENVLIFKPPKFFNWKNIMNRLDALGRTPVPTFLFQSGGKMIPYDMNKHKYMRNLAVAEVTKSIGWDARSSFQEEILEYYELHKSLLFKKFLIKLRNVILNTLNEVLNRIGNNIGVSVKLKTEGLPSLKDVEIVENHLISGTMNFKDVFEAF